MTTNKNTDKELPATSATKAHISFEESFEDWWEEKPFFIMGSQINIKTCCKSAWFACREQMREEFVNAEAKNERLSKQCKEFCDSGTAQFIEFRDKERILQSEIAQMRRELIGKEEDLYNSKKEHEGALVEIAQMREELIEAKEANKVLLCFVAQERAARTEAEAKCAEMREALTMYQKAGRLQHMTEDALAKSSEESFYAPYKNEAKAEVLTRRALSTSCGKGWASPDLVKEAIAALEEAEESFFDVYDDKHGCQMLRIREKLACLNQKEAGNE